MPASALRAPVVIEGVRLRLRRSTPDDAAATYRLANNIEVMHYMEWPSNGSVQETRRYLEGCAARWDAGTEFHWMVELKAAGEVLGSISCRVRGHEVDFGYLLAQVHWGRGYGSEAAALLVGWLRRQHSIVRIWATTDSENARSAAVLRKAGLQLEGVMRKATLRPNIGGPPRDTALYAWVRDDAREGVQEDVQPDAPEGVHQDT